MKPLQLNDSYTRKSSDVHSELYHDEIFQLQQKLLLNTPYLWGNFSINLENKKAVDI